MNTLDKFRTMSHREISQEPIIHIYEDVLTAKRKGLPKGTWELEQNVIIIFRYVLEIKEKLNTEQIPKINKAFIKEYKLWAPLTGINQ